MIGVVNVIFIKINFFDFKDFIDLVYIVLNEMLEKGCKKIRYGMVCFIGSVFFYI